MEFKSKVPGSIPPLTTSWICNTVIPSYSSSPMQPWVALFILSQNKLYFIHGTLLVKGTNFPYKWHIKHLCLLPSNRGLIAIEMLKRIEELCRKEIYELFDLICGSSTGAILAFLVGIKRVPLEECERTYRKLSVDVFEQNSLIGTGKLFWNHAYYNTAKFEKILKLVLTSVQMCLVVLPFLRA